MDNPILVKSYVTISTPIWGDDKNINDSFLKLKLILSTEDGGMQIAQNELRDNSGIGKGAAIYVNLDFANPAITKQSIQQIKLEIRYVKENYQRDLSMDEWDARAEAVLEFDDHSILATGYNDPAQHLEFTRTTGLWTPFDVMKSNCFDQPTLVAPFQ